jgi:hypothetical protein
MACDQDDAAQGEDREAERGDGAAFVFAKRMLAAKPMYNF